MRGTKEIQSLRGFRDILPQEQKYWRAVFKTFAEVAEANSFTRIDLPFLEETSLYKRSIGEDTDIVEKEMFSFVDQGGVNVTLRPEGTAGAVRAYIEHGMVNMPQPVKLYYDGPMFRHERPQSGRYRQFYQLGVEIFGGPLPVVDAEIIAVAYNVSKSLGLKVEIAINSLGEEESRENYKKVLQDYYKPKRSFLCENCKKRFLKNTLRLLDCKEEQCQEFKEESPQLVDHLNEEDRSHFVKVLEHLDEAEIPYILNPLVVRGLDYYTRTIFEVVPLQSVQENKEDASQDDKADGDMSDKEKQDRKVLKQEIGGGGRYDFLIEKLGGSNAPACGMALGVDRMINLMKTQKVLLPEEGQFDVFLAQLGEEAKKKSLKLFEILRLGGIRARANFSKDGLKQQLEIADKLGVRFTLILGQKEIMDGTLLIRDMESGIQELVDFNKSVSEVKKRLEKAEKIIITNGDGADDKKAEVENG